MTFSGFGLPDELAALRDLVGRFVREQLRPAEDALGPEATAIPPEVLAGLRQRARSLGLWCLDAPGRIRRRWPVGLRTRRGAQGSLQAPVLLSARGARSFGQSPPVVLYQGGPDILDRFVRPTIEHGWTSFTAIAEESGGSDPARAIRTAAKRDGDHYVLSGRKMWITNAERADYGVVYARTDAGISAFIVETSRPGVSTSRIPVIRNHAPTELVLDDVRIPAATWWARRDRASPWRPAGWSGAG